MEMCKYIFKGVLISFVTTLICLIILSALLTYTNLSEQIINPTIIIVTGISILIGSSIGNIRIRKNGLLNGALIGGIYLLFIYFVSSLLNWNFKINLQSIILIVVGIAFGILGGIIGVNKKVSL